MNINKKKSEPFISRRAQVFWMGLGMLIFLLCWTVPAQWEHINSLQPEYKFMAKIGALAPEFAIFCFLLFHSWDRSLTVRKCALIFGALLAGLVLVHGAGLWGMKDGKMRQETSEDRLTEKLSEYGKSVAETAEGKRPPGQQITRAEVREQGRVARERDKNAQALINQSISGRTDAIQGASFLSKSYMDGPMYAVNFIAALLLTSILTWLHFNPKIDDIDEDGDGIADINQGKVVEVGGNKYALNPRTGEPEEDYARYLEWKENQGKPQAGIPAPSPLRGGQFNPDGAIDIQPEPKPAPEPGKYGERRADKDGLTYQNTPLGPLYDEGQIRFSHKHESDAEPAPEPEKPAEVQPEPIQMRPWAKPPVIKNGKDPNA